MTCNCGRWFYGEEARAWMWSGLPQFSFFPPFNPSDEKRSHCDACGDILQADGTVERAKESKER